MKEGARTARFDDLSEAEQHTVQTYADELMRRDTLVDLASPADGETEPRDSYVCAIPSAESDSEAALRLLRYCD